MEWRPANIKRVKLISGDEYDAFSRRWRKTRNFKAGTRRRAKRGYQRRLRHAVKRQLKHIRWRGSEVDDVTRWM